MDNRKKRGYAAEKIAQRYLREQGMRLIQCNYRCRWGEIDIIAQEGDYLVFIEVRSRWAGRGGFPEEFLKSLKKKRLRKLIFYYLQKEVGKEVDCRLDFLVVNLDLSGSLISIKHFKGI